MHTLTVRQLAAALAGLDPDASVLVAVGDPAEGTPSEGLHPVAETTEADDVELFEVVADHSSAVILYATSDAVSVAPVA